MRRKVFLAASRPPEFAKTKVGNDARFHIPIEVRIFLGVREGEEIIIAYQNGDLVLTTPIRLALDASLDSDIISTDQTGATFFDPQKLAWLMGIWLEEVAQIMDYPLPAFEADYKGARLQADLAYLHRLLVKVVRPFKTWGAARVWLHQVHPELKRTPLAALKMGDWYGLERLALEL